MNDQDERRWCRKCPRTFVVVRTSELTLCGHCHAASDRRDPGEARFNMSEAYFQRKIAYQKRRLAAKLRSGL